MLNLQSVMQWVSLDVRITLSVANNFRSLRTHRDHAKFLAVLAKQFSIVFLLPRMWRLWLYRLETVGSSSTLSSLVSTAGCINPSSGSLEWHIV